MNEKIHNLLSDPNVQFYLRATPRLRELIAQGVHPNVLKMTQDVQTALLEGHNLVLDNADVESFVKGTLREHEDWLFRTGEIRVVGTPAIQLEKTKEGS